jgi:hypothetical protein
LLFNAAGHYLFKYLRQGTGRSEETGFRISHLVPYDAVAGAETSSALLALTLRGTYLVLPDLFLAWMTQPGVPTRALGVNDANAYVQGRAGRLPCGLDVIVDANVQTTCLAGAQTGGTQDSIYIVPQSECILLEPGNREVFIRADQPLAKNFGVLLVVYEFSPTPSSATRRLLFSISTVLAPWPPLATDLYNLTFITGTGFARV